ncbi:MAG: glucose-6-phosphate isomerase [Chloroflexi bacterium]|nr:glucose-6-phosphate isomerase [Chloroflexota bacterium]
MGYVQPEIASMSSSSYEETVISAIHSQPDIAGRIWKKDYTLWSPQPDEITDRLGWLTIPDFMHKQVSDLNNFSREINADGIKFIVLLGMGGSSLGAEVLNQVFGRMPGFPKLFVLDSTIPAAIKAVREQIDPAHSLFIVSSKSGTTTEPLTLYAYFRSETEKATCKVNAGRHFVAITDPDSTLVKLAAENGFRRIFINPPDIGGRYSVLSYFGLVPAVLIGIDISKLLGSADNMRERCSPDIANLDNPGSRLGAYIGSMANRGRNKLTIITSPAISSLGLWIEQLVAESTGKEGKGLLPVINEPLVQESCYGNDRVFTYLLLEDDTNSLTHNFIYSIKNAGRPVAVYTLRNNYDLGAEFYRWEFGIAVAGAIMRIHPFNQPDVQRAKDATKKLLNEYVKSGKLPPIETGNSIPDLLSAIKEGNYLAILAYIRQTTESDQIIHKFRHRILQEKGIATTIGYGPRFLHSTGQLHKGGPDQGLFLQIMFEDKEDLAIPGYPYSFGILSKAEAYGDLLSLQSLNKRIAKVSINQILNF